MAKKELDVAIPILAVRDMPRVMAFYAQLGFKLLGPGAASVNVTVSVGVTTSDLEDLVAADLIKRSDNAMYQAKQSGRNRVIVAGTLRQEATVEEASDLEPG